MSKGESDERRRGERLLIRVTVRLNGIAENGSEFSETTEFCVANFYGALLRLKQRPKLDSMLTLTNGSSGNKTQPFRIVWVGKQLREGLWDVAVEMLNPDEEFWGAHFWTGGSKS
jgi:hypothetical protein